MSVLTVGLPTGWTSAGRTRHAAVAVRGGLAALLLNACSPATRALDSPPSQPVDESELVPFVPPPSPPARRRERLRPPPPSEGSRALHQQVVMQLPNDDGQIVSVGQGGQALVLEFWSPTCAPCRRKLPELVALAPRIEEHGAELVLVAVLNEGESVALARQQLTRWGVQRSFLVDREGISQQAAAIHALPATLVLDAYHVVTWVAPPSATAEDVVAAIGR